MDAKTKLKGFLSSFFCRAALIQTGIFVVIATVVFYGVCVPIRINENGMEPKYHSGRLNFCWRPRYWFSDVHRFQVVVIKLPGRRKLLVRRIVGLPGEVVTIRNGGVYIGKLLLDEPYVEHSCDWNMPSEKVAEGSFYVMGDNRSMSSNEAMFGQVPKKSVIGAPLW